MCLTIQDTEETDSSVSIRGLTPLILYIDKGAFPPIETLYCHDLLGLSLGKLVAVVTVLLCHLVDLFFNLLLNVL